MIVGMIAVLLVMYFGLFLSAALKAYTQRKRK